MLYNEPFSSYKDSVVNCLLIPLAQLIVYLQKDNTDKEIRAYITSLFFMDDEFDKCMILLIRSMTKNFMKIH